MRNAVNPYYVISPSYETGGASYCDPPEYGADVVTVEARTKREAVILGTRMLLKAHRNNWPRMNRIDGRSPFAGMKAEQARCGHGNPHFVMVGEQAVYLRCQPCEEAVKQ